MRAKFFTAFVAAAFVGSAVVADAQAVTISRDGRPERMAAIRHFVGLNAVDLRSLQNIYFGNAFEVRAGEIAARRGQSEWARQYGRDMVREHTMAQNELRLLGLDLGVEFDNNLPANMVRDLNRLNTAPAAAFDNVFRSLMMSSHAQASNTLQHAIKHGHNEDVRSLWIKMLPSVKDHYALAQTRQTVVGSLKPTRGV
jgi:putative membrane protein